MQFSYSPALQREFPQLVSTALCISGLGVLSDIGPELAIFHNMARQRLARAAESEQAEIQAWRKAFVQMGLKPTQYRCAAESLLRRFRKEHTLPRIHPVVDLCNAVSMAFAIPIAAFDLAHIQGPLQVRHALGSESYATLADVPEQPAAGEVVFADAAGHAHSRRWTNRQSGRSAVRADTQAILIVAEALHHSASHDIPSLRTALHQALLKLAPGCSITEVQAA